LSPVIAAASDLSFAVEEIAARFTEDTGMGVRLSLGSTGNFARQIREGAPFQMFMAADETFIFDLHRDGFTRDEGDALRVGRIVVMVPDGSTLVADGTSKPGAALEAGRITRFAIANPEHAPYGMRAEEALRTRAVGCASSPIWCWARTSARRRSSRCRAMPRAGSSPIRWRWRPKWRPRAAIRMIPEDWHEPLRQRMALLNGAGPVAEAFYAYVNAPGARDHGALRLRAAAGVEAWTGPRFSCRCGSPPGPWRSCCRCRC
jgi:molybdate transport system substrate-binding protein